MTAAVGRGSVTQQIQETAARRKMSAKIAELSQSVGYSRQSDTLTRALQDICSNFRREVFEYYYPDAWEERLIQVLKEALVDDIADLPLDDPLLGSDGCIYGRKSLSLYFSQVSGEDQELSPLTGEGDFTVIPHEAARACIAWLKRHDTYSENENIERAYRELEESGYAIPLPEPGNRRVRRALLDQGRLLRQQERELELLRQQVAALPHLSQEIEGAFQGVHARMDLVDERLLQWEAMKRIEEAEFTHEVARLEAQVANCAAGNRELTTRMARVEQSIAEVSQETRLLEEAVERAAVAVAEAKEARQNRMLGAALFILARVVISCATGVPLVTSMMRDVVYSAVDHGLARAGMPAVARAVTGGVLQGGMGASSWKMTAIGEGAIRGGAVGVVGVALDPLRARNPVLGGAIQGAVGSTLLGGAPTKVDAVKNAVAGSWSGVVTHETGVPISAVVSGSQVNINISAPTV